MRKAASRSKSKEANEILDKYESNRETGTEVIPDTAAFGIVSAVLLLAGSLGWRTSAALDVAAAVGAVSRASPGAAEEAANEIENEQLKISKKMRKKVQ